MAGLENGSSGQTLKRQYFTIFLAVSSYWSVVRVGLVNLRYISHYQGRVHIARLPEQAPSKQPGLEGSPTLVHLISQPDELSWTRPSSSLGSNAWCH